MSAQRRELLVGDRLRRQRDLLGVVERGALLLGEGTAVAPAVELADLFVGNAALRQRRRVEIDAESAAVELGYPHGDQRTQRRIDRRSFAVEHPIERCHGEEQLGHPRPQQRRIQNRAVLAFLIPEERPQEKRIAAKRLGCDAHGRFPRRACRGRYSRTRLSRNALPTTLTEESAIAAA